MAKYYTPTVEEFHYGFRFEFFDKDTDSWDCLLFRPAVKWQNLEYAITNKYVRVKHLDKADIESLGLTLRITEQGEDTEIYPDIYQGSSNIGTFYGQDSPHGESNVELFNTFYILKNKSELKKLMTQLGIETKVQTVETVYINVCDHTPDGSMVKKIEINETI